MREPFDNTRVKAEEIRTLLRKHVGQLSKTWLLRKHRRILAGQISLLVCWYHFLEAEAKRKKRSPLYLNICQHIVAGLAEQKMGSLAQLTRGQFRTLEKLLASILAGLAGKPIPPIPPTDFLAVSKTILIERGKPGPKASRKYDIAFSRRMKGERLAAIVKDLEPENYLTDPHGTLDRYSKAIQRRKARAALI